MPGQIDTLKKRVAAEQDATAKARLQEQLRVQEAYAEQIKELKPTPPNVTVNDRITLIRGDREIRISRRIRCL
jgi:cyclase